jgi:hypothetical protein
MENTSRALGGPAQPRSHAPARPPVDTVCDRRSVLLAPKPADHAHMQEIMRIVDSDERALAVRVEAAIARIAGPLVVSRFTLWYTTRPPVHHAVLRAEAPPEPLQ